MFKLPSFITSFSRRLRRLLFQKEKDEDVAAAGASTGSDGETTTEGAAHDDEIPDGGLVACVQVFVGYLVFMNTWGYIASFPFIQHRGHLQPLTMVFIGATPILLLNVVGLLSGRLADAGYRRTCIATGCFFHILSIFSTAVLARGSVQRVPLFLTQGIWSGIGHGLLFVPTISLIPAYFERHRAFAMALASCGTSTGDILFRIIMLPLSARTMVVNESGQKELVLKWTFIVIGIFVTINALQIVLFAKGRVPVRKSKCLLDARALKEPQCLLFILGSLLCVLGLYVSHCNVQSSLYGLEKVEFTRKKTLAFGALLNCTGMFGRGVAGFCADKHFGVLGTLIITASLSGILLLVWYPISTLASSKYPGALITWSIFYSFVSQASQSLVITAAASMTTDLARVGTRMSVILSVLSVAYFSGPVVGAYLVAAEDSKYGPFLYPHLFGGSALVVGSLVYLVLIFVKVMRYRRDELAEKEAAA